MNGVWSLISLDDNFVCHDDSRGPSFSKANGAELWVLLLEKAYAKINKCFANIEAGQTYAAMRDLTGAPGVFKENKDPNDAFNFLMECEKKKYLMTCSSNQTPSLGIEHKDSSGIISSHAYAILDVK